uniref:uncharacterized protein LOC103796504 n=1 Tax=Callithrix jacchus TaxID=9483 RepID=UPI0023DCF823|nr:uncharacterized protein LOC103796504 [Callithrix jacchus]
MGEGAARPRSRAERRSEARGQGSGRGPDPGARAPPSAQALANPRKGGDERRGRGGGAGSRSPPATGTAGRGKGGQGVRASEGRGARVRAEERGDLSRSPRALASRRGRRPSPTRLAGSLTRRLRPPPPRGRGLAAAAARAPESLRAWSCRLASPVRPPQPTPTPPRFLRGRSGLRLRHSHPAWAALHVSTTNCVRHHANARRGARRELEQAFAQAPNPHREVSFLKAHGRFHFFAEGLSVPSASATKNGEGDLRHRVFKGLPVRGGAQGLAPPKRRPGASHRPPSTQSILGVVVRACRGARMQIWLWARRPFCLPMLGGDGRGTAVQLLSCDCGLPDRARGWIALRLPHPREAASGPSQRPSPESLSLAAGPGPALGAQPAARGVGCALPLCTELRPDGCP